MTSTDLNKLQLEIRKKANSREGCTPANFVTKLQLPSPVSNGKPITIYVQHNGRLKHSRLGIKNGFIYFAINCKRLSFVNLEDLEQQCKKIILSFVDMNELYARQMGIDCKNICYYRSTSSEYIYIKGVAYRLRVVFDKIKKSDIKPTDECKSFASLVPSGEEIGWVLSPSDYTVTVNWLALDPRFKCKDYPPHVISASAKNAIWTCVLSEYVDQNLNSVLKQPKLASVLEKQNQKHDFVLAVRFKELKSCWGECCSKKNGREKHLVFCSSLAAFPEVCIKYVLIHEACHLAEFNHSPRFWELVSSIMPEWEEGFYTLKHYESMEE